ncbi:hexose kinase [Oceanotoga sp. DSM 15011]|jgi:1-phosphofructokinase|uniref:Fructose-1-phosphate kinase n=1 Tax=Oceanotoga teriensis TaxID=515440 RepID=A0AA45C7U4_9BACT|nr:MULTISPECIES: hexose kinase [Oceanotoga]MDN5343288.1 1-phosphofructokinase [Oceanotoga sp.]MDO7976311.1 hexose kinase [Oceanotoga teriensis]PWJ95512.1 fructose-1-phosphate kinase [Oceanotoga teriensis]UYP01150.1 hexose kinase [Oceanotoga sp. DSM 15011]
MIITLTLNPAFDKTIEVKSLKKGDLNKIDKENIDIGGKGINVSKVFDALGIPNISIIFAGEKNIKEFESKLKKVINNYEIILNKDVHTRENIKIFDKKTQKITELNSKGEIKNLNSLKQLLDKLDSTLQNGDILILSGSTPNNCPKDIYSKIIKKAKEKNVYVVLDTSGENLEYGLKASPNLIKPNIKELEEIEKNSKNDLNNMLNSNINILLSNGENGFNYISKTLKLKIEPFKLNVKSTVGAGDSLLAGFIYGIYNNKSLEESLIMARACASAKVVTEGTKNIKKEKILAYIKEGGINYE